MKRSGCLITIAIVLACTMFVFFAATAIHNYIDGKRVAIERVDYFTSETQRSEPLHNYYYYAFDESEYDADTLKVIDAFFNQEDSVFIADADIDTYFEINEALHRFFYEDYADTRWTRMLANINAEENKDGINILISYNDANVEEYLTALEIAEVTIAQMDISYLTDIGVIKAAYDYIVLNTEYDYEAVENNTVSDMVNYAYGVFVNGKAVCGGYSQAYSMLLSLAGIENRYVTGSEELRHAWNMVEIDGCWYHCDVTYGDNGYDGCAIYNYFLKNDEYMEAFETGRLQDDLPAVGQNYYFENIGYDVYTYNNKLYACTLVDNNLVRYEVKDNTLDESTGKVLVRNILSWYLSSNLNIVYNSAFNGTISIRTYDGRYRRTYSYAKVPHYIIAAQYADHVYTITFAEDMHGEPIEVNLNAD